MLQNYGGFMTSLTVTDPNRLELLTFLSDLANKLIAVTEPQDPAKLKTPTAAGTSAILRNVFIRFKSVVDGLNTTDAVGNPLQKIVNDGEIEKLWKTLYDVITSPVAIPGATKPTEPQPKVGALKTFTDSIGDNFHITDLDTLNLLEKVVSALNEGFSSATFKGLEGEIERKIGPEVGRKLFNTKTVVLPYHLTGTATTVLNYAPGFVTNPTAKAFKSTILFNTQWWIETSLGFKLEDVNKTKVTTYTGLLQYTLNLFLFPLQKKILDDKAFALNNLNWEQIDKKTDSLSAGIATSKKQVEEQISKIESQPNQLPQQASEDVTAQVLKIAEQAKELEKSVLERTGPEKIRLEATKKDLESFLARVKEMIKNPGNDPKTSFLKLVSDIEEKFPRVPGASPSPLHTIIDDLKDKASKLPNVPPPPLPENEFLVRINEMLAHPEKYSKEEIEKLISDIESKFPRDPNAPNPLHKISDDIKAIASKPETLATPAPKQGWWEWAKGFVVSSPTSSQDPLNQLKDFFAAEVAKKKQGWLSWIGNGAVSAPGAVTGWLKSSHVKAPLDKLENFFQAAIVENQKVIDLSIAVKTKAGVIVGEANKLVELESKKQEKAITSDVEKIYIEQLGILNSLEEKIADLKQGVDSYKKSHFQFFHRFFNTKSYRVHNVIEAHAKFEEAIDKVALKPANFNEDMQEVLGAQKKFGEALSKLDKTYQMPISKIEHIKAALDAHEKLEESRPKKPTKEPSSSLSELVIPPPPEAVVVTTAKVVPSIVPIPSSQEMPKVISEELVADEDGDIFYDVQESFDTEASSSPEKKTAKTL